MKFLKPADARAACPNLDTSLSMRIDEYDRLLGETMFPRLEFVECQLINVKGHECRQKFGIGFVVQTKSGAAVYVGGDCKDNHIETSADARRMATDAELLVRRNRINDLIDRINARRSDETYSANLLAAWKRGEDLRQEISRERRALPQKVLGRLMDMVKTGRRGVPGEVKYVEHYTDNEGNPRVSINWQPVTLGTVASPEGLDIAALDVQQDILRSAINLLREAAPEPSQGEKVLKEVIAALDSAVPCAARIAELENALERFLRPENLRAASWLALRSEDQEVVVAQALHLAGSPSRPNHVRVAIGEWRREIESAHGGREFRPLG